MKGNVTHTEDSLPAIKRLLTNIYAAQWDIVESPLLMPGSYIIDEPNRKVLTQNLNELVFYCWGVTDETVGMLCKMIVNNISYKIDNFDKVSIKFKASAN
jgi:hypothetical protein